jgi:hypothetical protein
MTYLTQMHILTVQSSYNNSFAIFTWSHGDLRSDVDSNPRSPVQRRRPIRNEYVFHVNAFKISKNSQMKNTHLGNTR